jgi:arylsulfatase A-like enzyme
MMVFVLFAAALEGLAQSQALGQHVETIRVADGLTLWEVTIAKFLSNRGYATGIWGKWHLGSDESRFPTHQGFDEWYGIPRTYDEAFWPSLNEATGLWTGRTCQQRDRPYPRSLRNANG